MLRLLFLSLVLSGVMGDTKLRHDHDAPTVVTPEHLTAFQHFSGNLLQQKNYYDAYQKTGAVSYCTYTVGLLLANVNEQAFNVRTAGIVKALELPRENITNAYSTILHSFLEDSNVSANSILYTPKQDLVLGPNYKKLHTVVDVLPLHGNAYAASYINRQIGVNTHHAIVDRLVPHDPPFNESAAGVFVNTFYYKSTWETPVVLIGETTFTTPNGPVQVKTLETTGTFPHFENDQYTAVALPLTGGRKQVIFVAPKKSVKNYLTSSVRDIFKSESNPANWNKKLLRVQVPYLNLVLGRNYQAELDDLAKTEISCCGKPDPVEVVDPTTRHYIQPVVQVLSTRLSEQGFELGVTNGAQVNKVSVPVEVIPTVEPVVPTIKSGNVVQEVVVDSGKYSRNTRDVQGMVDFVVNNPFFVYLRDNELGAVSFTAIQSTFDIARDSPIPQSRHHIDDISTDFTEETKVHRWNCHPEHEHDHNHGHDHASPTTVAP